MKKLMSFVLSAALFLSLSACSKASGGPSAGSSSHPPASHISADASSQDASGTPSTSQENADAPSSSTEEAAPAPELQSDNGWELTPRRTTRWIRRFLKPSTPPCPAAGSMPW